MRIKLLLLLTLVIVSGCGPRAFGTGMRGEDSIPPRPVGASYPNWEHLCVGLGAQFGEVLDRAGAAGWEMVGIGTDGGGVIVCFKRPAVTGPASTLADPPSGNEVSPQSSPASAAPVPPPSE